jgi:hypothetical protein
MASDDIVARLRNAPWTTADDCNAAADEIERLRKERDEARRLYLASTYSDDEIIHEMKRHGWDCFKEDGKPCQ